MGKSMGDTMNYKNLILIVVFFLAIHGCRKVMLPEPHLPENRRTPAEYELPSTNTLEGTFQSIMHEILGFLSSNNIDSARTYAVFLQKLPAHNQSPLIAIEDNIKKTMSTSIPIVSIEELGTLLRKDKNITVLELQYEYHSPILRVLADAYSPAKKKALCSLEVVREISSLEAIPREKEEISENVASNKDMNQATFIDELNEKVIAMKSLDINNDGKKDILLLDEDMLHVWLIAYNVVIDKMRIPLGDMNEIRSRDPVGLIMTGKGHYIYLINSHMKNGVCISLMQETDEQVACTEEIMDSFPVRQIANIIAMPGTNLFRISSPQGTEFIFHNLDISTNDATNEVSLYCIMKDNKIYGLDANNLQLIYQSDFAVGRGFSFGGNYMIATLSNLNCPPDGVIIYGLRNSKFTANLTLYESEGCIMALDIQDIRGGLIEYVYAVYDTNRTVSKIYVTAVNTGESRRNTGHS